MTFHLASDINEVLDIALAEDAEAAASSGPTTGQQPLAA